jgi:hypothetical protein
MQTLIGNIVNIKKLLQILSAAGMLTTLSNSFAAEIGGVELSGSGFMTIAAGKMLGGSSQNTNDYNCPCFAADYAQAGVYDGRSDLQWNPDSKLGLQGSASFDERRFSVTAQVVSRGAQQGAINLEWLYASYKINDMFTVQAGRKRLPMFYYSDSQDIGVALPWAHLPPQLYGWEAVNYNGMNLAYQDQWGDWTANASILAGSENRNESGYWKIYNGRMNRTNIKWNNIVGADLALSKDWLETRVVYIQSNNQTQNANGAWNATTQSYDPATIQTDFINAFQQEILGVSANIDYNDWLLRSECIQITRPGNTWKDLAWIVGGGYHFGKWQPMVTWSVYKAIAVGAGDPNGQEGHFTMAYTLRYDLTTSSDIKLQLDNQRDQSGPNWHPNSNFANDTAPYGNAQLLTLAYDMVF